MGKINWTLVGLAAAAFFFLKKKPAAAAEVTEEQVTGESLKTSVIQGDLDMGDDGTSWIPGW
jgi:hypothetical protein